MPHTWSKCSSRCDIFSRSLPHALLLAKVACISNRAQHTKHRQPLDESNIWNGTMTLLLHLHSFCRNQKLSFWVAKISLTSTYLSLKFFSRIRFVTNSNVTKGASEAVDVVVEALKCFEHNYCFINAPPTLGTSSLLHKITKVQLFLEEQSGREGGNQWNHLSITKMHNCFSWSLKTVPPPNNFLNPI